MPTEILIAVLGAFVAVATLAASATSWWLAQRTPEQRRLRPLAESAVSGLLTPQKTLAQERDPRLARLTRLLPKSPKEMSRLQRRLARAGYPRYSAVVVYAFAELLLPLVFGAIVLGFMGVRVGFIPAILAGAIGYAIPGLWAGRQRMLREKSIQNALPDALDLLTVSVEAGSGLDQAIFKASEELRIAHPRLAEELRFISTEIRAGKPRLEAFQNFAQRTGVEDVRTLVSMLTQTDRFGTSISQALRIHAETSRTKRRQRAEERAAKVGVKLVFPLALCLFPALYVVCFGPAVVRIYRAFFANG